MSRQRANFFSTNWNGWKKTLHYPWAEVDNPVELHNQAGFAFLETKLCILKAWARSQPGPGESAGPPRAHVALQVPAVLVLWRLLWRRKGFIVTYRAHKKNIGAHLLTLRARWQPFVLGVKGASAQSLPPQSSKVIWSSWFTSSYLLRNSFMAVV